MRLSGGLPLPRESSGTRLTADERPRGPGGGASAHRRRRSHAGPSRPPDPNCPESSQGTSVTTPGVERRRGRSRMRDRNRGNRSSCRFPPGRSFHAKRKRQPPTPDQRRPPQDGASGAPMDHPTPDARGPNAARNRFDETDLTIEAVATRTGHRQPSFFIKHFRRDHTGNTGNLAAPSARHPVGRRDMPRSMPDRVGA